MVPNTKIILLYSAFSALKEILFHKITCKLSRKASEMYIVDSSFKSKENHNHNGVWIIQHAKKVMSIGLGLVNLLVKLVNSVIHLKRFLEN